MANLPGMDSHVATDRRSDAAMAYALFRFTFGVNIMMRGIVRIAIGIPAFQTYMLTQFKDVPVMPPAFLMLFASVLPFVETLIGFLILVGFQTRTALIAGSLMITALTFGTMMRSDFTIAWLQLDYAIAFFLLLALRSWNVISVDGMMRTSSKRSGVLAA
jgi:thiosulfate dehydrogenase [quinone] large subunit